MKWGAFHSFHSKIEKVISCEIICKPIQGLGLERFLLMVAVKVAMKFAMKFYGWEAGLDLHCLNQDLPD